MIFSTVGSFGCGSGHTWDLGARRGSAKAPAWSNAAGGSTACATRRHTRLAEACRPELRNTIKHRVEDLVDVSDIFYFFCSGEESEAPGRRGGGGYWKSQKGGSPRRRGGGPRGWEGICGEFGGGGGLNIFFQGRNSHQEEMRAQNGHFGSTCAQNAPLLEARCAHWKRCYPETPLGSHPTSRVSPRSSPSLLLQVGACSWCMWCSRFVGCKNHICCTASGVSSKGLRSHEASRACIMDSCSVLWWVQKVWLRTLAAKLLAKFGWIVWPFCQKTRGVQKSMGKKVQL